MIEKLKALLKDGAVRDLLQRILTVTVGDRAAENKEDADRKKLEAIIPKELIGSMDGERVEGSPWVWTGGTDPYVIDIESGKNLLELGYSKKDLQKLVKQVKAKVNELNGTTAQREAELQANKEKKQAEQERKDKERAEREEAERQKAEEKAKQEAEAMAQAIDEFKKSSGLNALGTNKTKLGWCSVSNRLNHVDANGQLKHQKEYPNMSEEEYLAMASELSNQPVDGQKILGYGCYDEWGTPTICRYNAETNDYVKMNARGLITMYKPDDKLGQYIDYREAQATIKFKGERNK